MPFCPQCASEYRTEITTCAHCQVPLVPELPPDRRLAAEKHTAYFEGQPLELITEGGVELAQEIQTLLEAGGVPARITGRDENAELAPMHMRFKVEVVKEDVPKAAQVLGKRWTEVVAAEGSDSHVAKEAVLAAGAETECPACGTKFTPASTENAECPDCGLFLGVPSGT